MPGRLEKARCGSPASIGLPVAVRLGASAQLFAPAAGLGARRQPGSGRADRLAKIG